jgi:hypothetical protein
MSMYSPEEQRIEDLAVEAIKYADEKSITLTEGLSKVAEDYGLSNPEIENVCAKINHIKYNSLRIKNKLASFKKADYTNVVKSVKKVAEELEYKAEFRKNPELELTAELNKEAEEDINDYTPTRDDLAYLGVNANDNADKLIELSSDRDKKLLQMRNTIVSLIQNGESIKNIYEVLLKTWGSGNKEQLDVYFSQLINDLKAEGLIDSRSEFEIPGSSELPDREVADNSLSKVAREIININDNIVKKEIIHDSLLHLMCKHGKESEARKLDEYVPDSFCVSEKYAASKYTIPILTALTGLGTGMALNLGDNLVLKIREESVKKTLPEKFPELKDIPTEKFNNIYQTITALNPILLKAPYALSETIKKVYVHDTMDQNTINMLISSGSKSKPSVINQQLQKAIDISMNNVYRQNNNDEKRLDLPNMTSSIPVNRMTLTNRNKGTK